MGDRIVKKGLSFRWIALALFGACALVAAIAYLRAPPTKQLSTERLERRIKNVDADPRWVVEYTPEKMAWIQQLFSQPFYYLGQGRQCHAYVSQDGEYVVKFFLQKPLILKSRFANLPDAFPFTLLKQYKTNLRIQRKNNLFSSCLISYERAPEQTGIVFVHLNPVKGVFPTMLFMDRSHNPCTIQLDDTQFVVQKRAHLLKTAIAECMWSGDVAGAEARVSQALELLYECAKLGVVDVDPGLFRNDNIGLLEDRAIYIDTGKLRYMPEKQTKEAFVEDLKRLEPFCKWLSKYYPELATYYETREKELIDSF